jgi:cytosine permease
MRKAAANRPEAPAEAAADDFALERVPYGSRRPMRDLLWVELGVVTATSEFVLAAALGYSMTLAKALIAIVIGTAILLALSTAIGVMGVREGLSSGVLARWSGFGEYGAAAISLAIVIGNIAWFGV